MEQSDIDRMNSRFGPIIAFLVALGLMLTPANFFVACMYGISILIRAVIKSPNFILGILGVIIHGACIAALTAAEMYLDMDRKDGANEPYMHIAIFIAAWVLITLYLRSTFRAREA